MNNVGIRIKSLRENNNLSQKQFAERIMVSQSYLSRIERGIEVPNNKLIKLIALEFNVNTDWISKGKGNPDSFHILISVCPCVYKRTCTWSSERIKKIIRKSIGIQ